LVGDAFLSLRSDADHFVPRHFAAIADVVAPAPHEAKVYRLLPGIAAAEIVVGIAAVIAI